MLLGIDLGGTKIEGIALGDDGAELARLRVPTPPDYDATVETLAGVVEELERRTGMTGSVGVGIPGTIVPATGLVKNANSTRLIGRPFRDDVARRLGREVRMVNDANCFAVSEATDGAGAGAEVVFGVILGTGVGGGIVVRGRVLEGANLIAGEWGHNALPWPSVEELPGPECYCGRRGCIEAWLSGPGLSRDHERVAGQLVDAPELSCHAAGGDAAALASLDRYLGRLARALASVINVLDPDVIVLGGGMSNVPGLADAVRERLAPWVFSDTIATRVVKNVHGDSSGVRGAAWLWKGGGPGGRHPALA
jgi:fructokinase